MGRKLSWHIARHCDDIRLETTKTSFILVVVSAYTETRQLLDPVTVLRISSFPAQQKPSSNAVNV
jgi:hypothetical protein